MSGSSHVASNIIATIKAVLSVCVILGVGLLLVRYKVLDQGGVTSLSKLVNGLFLPLALFMRLGSTLSREVLARTWQLPIVFLLPMALSFLIGGWVVNHTKVDRKVRPWLVVGLAFTNNLPIPLAFLTSICAHVEFDASDGLSASGAKGGKMSVAECLASGELYLFMGNLFTTFVFWLVAYDVAAALTGGARAADSEELLPTVLGGTSAGAGAGAGTGATGAGEGERSQPPPARRRVSTAVVLDGSTAARSRTAPAEAGPASVSAAAGVAPTEGERTADKAGLELTGLHDSLELTDEAAAAPGSSAPPQFHSAMDDTAWSEVSAAVASTPATREWSRFGACAKLWTKLRGISLLLLRPPILAQIVAFAVALIPPLKWVVFDPSSPLSPVTSALAIFPQANVPALNLVLCGSLGLKVASMRSLRQPDLAGVGLSTHSMVAVVTARMVLLPVLSIAAIYGLMAAGVIPDNKLMQMVSVLPCLTPTGNGPVVLAQMSGAERAGQALALCILFQYLAGLVTMSAFVFASFQLVMG
jgi:predicted permease